MNRRTFLKIAGMGSVSFAFGCNPPQKNLFSLVEAPDDMVTGQATWYAATCRECPAGCGILAKNREGRIIKIEGNPLHPINKGKICMRGQAALQAIYNPDRITTPLFKQKGEWQSLTFDDAQFILQARVNDALGKGPNRVRMLTEVTGNSLMNLFREAFQKWNSPDPLVFEPYAYESLKTANQKVFGVDGLVSYRMDEADVLVSFGADFLETWLSPVEYAWKFKAMHAINNGKKGLFFHINPYQSMTGANADFWLACKPGSESVVALGLVRQALDIRKGKNLPQSFINSLYKATAPYTQDRVLQLSGLPLPLYEKLILQLMGANKPLVLGSATGASDLNGLQTNLAVNLLNLLLDPDLRLLDFANRHRVEIAAKRAEVLDFINELKSEAVDLLILNNVNPIFTLPPNSGIKEALENSDLFVVSFSNFMDETSKLADLILPVNQPLETWDEYSGWQTIVSTQQPAMGKLTEAPHLGDVILNAAFEDHKPAKDFKTYLVAQLGSRGKITNELDWVQTLQKGGIFKPTAEKIQRPKRVQPEKLSDELLKTLDPAKKELVFQAVPSIRFFDGRGANKSWLCEVPDPLTKVAWQTPVIVHPQVLQNMGLVQGDIIKIESKWGGLEAPIYETENIHPQMLVMGIGQGHDDYGRYAGGMGINPLRLLSPEAEKVSGGPMYGVRSISIQKTGRSIKLAHTDGSRYTEGRKIALSVDLKDLRNGKEHASSEDEKGLGMDEFPFTLPTEEGYDPKRDFYPPHKHEDYRWAMVVDLDRCIGCAACTVACQAENNVAVVGLKRVLEQREMAWLWVERFYDPKQMEKTIFLPLLCQHCDNAPCEVVCPVYAAHHSKEGLNNQIYNRCVGTRFCSQNCPYKARRFNWFDWQWPEPSNLQLNPDVTVRSKGVMEKCSFCLQRIKKARDFAKNENRKIRDGEIQPACLQTCPTDVFTFGNIMDKNSRVRQMVEDKRRYQMLGYLNTKPAVIYLSKVLQEL